MQEVIGRRFGYAQFFSKKQKFLLLFASTSAIILSDALGARYLTIGLEVQLMAKCDICGKGVTFGIKVSHSHRRSNRMWKPNVKRVKAVVDGTPRHVYVCTRCLRSNKVERAI